MSPETMLSYVRAKPFRPFRIIRTDGITYDVTHPAFVRVGVDYMLFFFKKHPDAPYDRFDIFGPEVIAKVEYVDALPTARGLS